jgi:predicted CXXCH cytochrome family protein
LARGLSLAAVVAVCFFAGRVDAQAPDFVGSEVCAGCHSDAADAWADSHHSWAWRKVTPDNVLADFDGATFEHMGERYSFTRRGSRYAMTVENLSGEARDLVVQYIAGIEPLQQYLVETEEGRLQSVDVVWDTERKHWYHLYPEQDLDFGDGLHWTGPYKTWNARCAECHATDFHKNYDPETRRYASTQSEIGVGCEACHGPGEAHVAWAKEGEIGQAADAAAVGPSGLLLAFAEDDPETEIQLCAGCHSRREPLGASSPLPGTPYADSYRLALLREGLYHADGQILDEVYVYGSFLQSKMYDRGVRCTNCHEPHGGTLRVGGNAVCTQCHNSEGREEFPTLRSADYDSAEHHFHQLDTPGAQCVSCHMIERSYMVVDGRRDHSFRVPRPDLSASLGTPNACTDCHADRSASWAAEQVAGWYPAGGGGRPHFASVFAKARGEGDVDTGPRLLEIAQDPDQPAIVRATALDLLARHASPEHAARAAVFLEDENPLVRAAALASQRARPPADRLRDVTPLLSDPARSVRTEAARQLLDLRNVRYPDDLLRDYRVAMREYQESLAAKADFPEVQQAIAGLALTLGNHPAAMGAFREATRLDPQMVDSWIMLGRIDLARGDAETAAKTLRRGAALNPEQAVLHQWLGRALWTASDAAAAIAALETARKLRPDDAAIAADLGIFLSMNGDHEKALPLLEEVRAAGISDPDVLRQQAFSQHAGGLDKGAQETLEALRRLHPGHPYIAELQAILER